MDNAMRGPRRNRCRTLLHLPDSRNHPRPQMKRLCGLQPPYDWAGICSDMNIRHLMYSQIGNMVEIMNQQKTRAWCGGSCPLQSQDPDSDPGHGRWLWLQRFGFSWWSERGRTDSGERYESSNSSSSKNSLSSSAVVTQRTTHPPQLNKRLTSVQHISAQTDPHFPLPQKDTLLLPSAVISAALNPHWKQ